MTSSFTQPTLFVDNTTTYNITTEDEEFSTDDILSIPPSSISSCKTNCYTHVETNDDDVTYITKFIYSFLVIAFVITISIVVIFRRVQHLQKQKRKGKESIHIDKLYAHPFEEIVIIVDKPESVELLEITPTPPTN